MSISIAIALLFLGQLPCFGQSNILSYFRHALIFFLILRSIISNFTNLPVTLERKPILNLDDWENALDEQITKYSSVFEVDYDQEYVIKVIISFKKCEY